MITTFAIHVENKPGVLTRVSSLFRRRAFNIESLTVGHTDRPGVSRMTIVVDTDELGARRIEAHIYKLVNVLRVENITLNAGGVPRSGDDQGCGVRRIADAHHAARRRVPRAGRRRGARLAHHRDHGHRGQDRRPARSAAAVRRARDGAHGPRGDVARPAQRDQRPGRRGRAPPKTITTYFTLFSVSQRRDAKTQRILFKEESSASPRLCVEAQKRTLNGSEDVLRQRRGSRADSGEEGGHHRLRIAGARARAEPEGQRRAGEGGARGEQQVEGEGRSAWPVGHDARRSGEVGRRRHDSRARHDGARGVCGDRAAHDQGQDADVRARLQHPVRHREAVEGHRRHDDCAEGAGSSRPRAVRRRRRHAGADRRRAGRDRQRQGARACRTPRASA